MATVNIGRMTFNEGTDEAAWGFGGEPAAPERPALFSDPDAAAAALGTDLRLPSSVPDGFLLSVVEVAPPDASGQSRIAVAVYKRRDGASFELEQSVLGENALEHHDEITIPASGLHSVAVRSRPAAAWTLRLPPPLIRTNPVELAQLAWEEDGCRFLLTSTSLNENKLLPIAQSV